MEIQRTTPVAHETRGKAIEWTLIYRTQINIFFHIFPDPSPNSAPGTSSKLDGRCLNIERNPTFYLHGTMVFGYFLPPSKPNHSDTLKVSISNDRCCCFRRPLYPDIFRDPFTTSHAVSTLEKGKAPLHRLRAVHDCQYPLVFEVPHTRTRSSLDLYISYTRIEGSVELHVYRLHSALPCMCSFHV